jgi:hypothetical protein
VLELSRDFYFMEEASGAEGCRQFRPEDLQCHHAAMLGVSGEVDCGHAAVAKLALERITLGQSGLKAIGGSVGQLEILPEVLY